ncbi:hypothetical protein [Parafrankia sp. EUN1f]|uniref:hypothetical protein n=1 Tax=Parafrankia sp. EUN1f TaxID=102897 RepID=UPI0001C459A4|nr:hypothetical protein [Parafrankia sp. EUN1f]EFC86491.1 hypothetical protein FrEUN1fDRAFT_0386 [Parafrankia sp. EUN1f]
MPRWRTILCWPDTHVPDQHTAAVENLTAFAAEFNPDRLLILGDFLDMKGPARWSRGLAEEYQTDLQADCDTGVKILENIRAGYGGPIDFVEGNHEARIRRYLAQYAPALRELRSLQLEALLNFEDLEISYRHQPYRLGDGWVAIHGDKIAAYGGGSALKMVRQFGASVVQGHTHRLAVVTESRGYRDRQQSLTGMECGHLSDLSKASYVGFGSANWQLGFGLLHLDDTGRSAPEVYPIHPDGSILVQGVEYPAPDFSEFDRLIGVENDGHAS